MYIYIYMCENYVYVIYHNDQIVSLWGIFVVKLRCISWCISNPVLCPHGMVGCAVWTKPRFHGHHTKHQGNLKENEKNLKNIESQEHSRNIYDSIWSESHSKPSRQAPRSKDQKNNGSLSPGSPEVPCPAAGPGETFPACLAKSGQVSIVMTLNRVYMDCLGAISVPFRCHKNGILPRINQKKNQPLQKSPW